MSAPASDLSADEAGAPHRLALAEALSRAVLASLAAGDPKGARVAVDALRGLVDAAERDVARTPSPDGATVVDLGTERRRRER